MHLIHHLNESFYHNGNDVEHHRSPSDFSFSLGCATLKDSFQPYRTHQSLEDAVGENPS